MHRIGRYEIRGSLGSGGMGEVLEAWDPTLERPVAIKLLPEAFAADSLWAERFLREGRALARFQHPNIVAVYEAGGTGQTYYLAMEFVRGRTLRQILRERLPTWAEVRKWAVQIAAALAYAHERGVVHRDVKPENAMIDERGELKLMDFGIAQLAGTDGLTQAGLVMGTVNYIAPEQAQGGEVSGAADVYALGVVLFQLATGSLPFKGSNPASVVAQHVTAPIPEPAAVSPRPLPAGLPEVIKACLEKEPAARPSAAMVVGVLEGKVALVRAPGPGPATTVPIEERNPPSRLSDRSTETGPVAVAPRSRPWWDSLLIVALLIVAGSIAVNFGLRGVPTSWNGFLRQVLPAALTQEIALAPARKPDPAAAAEARRIARGQVTAGDLAAASISLERAVSLDFANPAIRLELAELYERKGRDRPASREFAEAARLLMAAGGEPAAIERALTSAVRLNPENRLAQELRRELAR